MQQRQLRLGDVLDDYCPRERRITNHAVVAMLGQQVKQTRCTTCEAEHDYKEAKAPASRKKKEAPASPRHDAATVLPEGPLLPVTADSPELEHPRQKRQGLKGAPVLVVDVPPADPAVAPRPEPPPQDEQPVEAALAPDADADNGGEDDGPVHRRLIRATLPRPEGQVTRPTPQFTMRQPAGRSSGFGDGKARSGGRGHSSVGGRPPGAAGGARGGRQQAFPHGTGRDDPFGRTRGREPHPHQSRHSPASHAARPGKKRSK